MSAASSFSAPHCAIITQKTFDNNNYFLKKEDWVHIVKDVEQQAEEFVLDLVGNGDLLKIFEWGQ